MKTIAKRLITASLLICGMLSARLSAQIMTDRPDTSDKAGIGMLRQKLVMESFTPYGSSNFVNGASNISFSSTLNGGQNGKIEFQLKLKDSTTFIGLSADQKLGKNADEAIPFDLLGISTGTTAALSFQQMHWKPKLKSAEEKKLDDVLNAYSQRKGIDRRGVTLNDVRQNGTAEERRAASRISSHGAYFLNGKISVTKVNYSYVQDSVTLQEESSSHLLPAFTVSGGKVLVGRRGNISYLSLSYKYGITYNEGDQLSLLMPFGTSGNYVSKDVTFGAPSRKVNHIVTCEWRSNIALGSDKIINSIGIAPSVSYSIAKEEAVVLLPVYFINGTAEEGKPKGLQGGIRFGYYSSTKDQLQSFKEGFNVQLFIAAPFSLI